MKIEIENIKVRDRLRKELGDIRSLAQSIKEIGLINPVTVAENGENSYRLLAGERRLKACKSLGWKEIEAKVIDNG